MMPAQLEVREARRVRSPIAFAALAALLLLAACASTPPPSPSPSASTLDALADVSIDGYEHVRAELDFDNGVASLPIDEFTKGNPAIQMKALHAIALLADRCLAEQGLPTLSERYDWSPYTDEENRRYGLWSVSLASKHGLDVAPSAGLRSRNIDTTDLGVDFNEAYERCRESAEQALWDELTFLSDADLDRRIRLRSAELALAHSDGATAAAAWRACTDAHEVVIDPTNGLPSEHYAAQSEESAIRVAVIQAECAASTGAIQTLFDLQARYEAAFIDQQAAALREFSVRLDEVVTALDEVIARG